MPVKYPLDLDELMSEKSSPISNDVDVTSFPKKQQFPSNKQGRPSFQKQDQRNPSFLRKTLEKDLIKKQEQEKPSFQREEQENNSFKRREETKKEKPSVTKKETSRMEKFRTFSAVP